MSPAAPAGSAPAPAATTVDGVRVDVAQITRDDPTLPVHLTWPVLSGLEPLTERLSGWAHEREAAFLAENQPNTEAPPELAGTWAFALPPGSPVAGVRQQVWEFAGASGASDSRTTYAERSSGRVWASADLVRPEARQQAVAAVVAAVRAGGRSPLDELAAAPETADALLADLAFDGAGGLTVHVGEGVVTPFSDGTFTVTVPAAVAEPLLSEAGRAVRDAYRAHPPAPEPATPPATAAPTPDPGPTAAAPPPAAAGASVDCSVARCVALTFDDGPGPHTARLLDSLDAAGVKATFFVLGSSVRAYPRLVRRMVDSGMAIGNHSFDHKQMTKLSPTEQRGQLDRTNAALRAAGAPAAPLMRPPYGSFNDATRTLGVPIILWDVDTLDWKNKDAAAVTQATLRAVRPGSIVLLHDIHPTTVDAVPGIVTRLQAEGYTLVTVPQLLPNAKGGERYSRR